MLLSLFAADQGMCRHSSSRLTPGGFEAGPSYRRTPTALLGRNEARVRVLCSRRAVALAIPLLVVGCTGDQNPLVSTGPIEDLERIPQDAAAFITAPDIAVPESDERRLRDLTDYWYGPWEQTKPEICTPDEFSWAAASFRKQPVFGPNLLELSDPAVEAVIGNAQLDQYPSRAQRAISVRNTSLRALPSMAPFFRDFRRAGEGYPFDYNQNSAVWAGTPLFVSHVSLDGRFVAVESPYTCGWIDTRDIGYVDNGFAESYRSRELAAVVRDRTAIVSGGAGFLFEGRVGMLLPMEPGTGPRTGLLVPVADESRRASITPVELAAGDVVRVPLPFTGEQFASVINEIVGQPYGWGGLGGYRDCSSTVLDLLLPFGLPLPRNSGDQAEAGKRVDMEQLTAAEKEERILGEAAPFRTLLNLPGHVMLYLGPYEGAPVAFHTIWGLRTESPDGSHPGRHVIGKSVITSLSPGNNLEALSRSRGDLLSRIDSFTLVGEQSEL